jgi:hypothetical protein
MLITEGTRRSKKGVDPQNHGKVPRAGSGQIPGQDQGRSQGRIRADLQRGTWGNIALPSRNSVDPYERWPRVPIIGQEQGYMGPCYHKEELLQFRAKVSHRAAG